MLLLLLPKTIPAGRLALDLTTVNPAALGLTTVNPTALTLTTVNPTAL